jgi:outer membrane protein OmpA-like peptidoglycan-associated protein
VNTKLMSAFAIAVGLSAMSQANAQSAMPEGTNGHAPLFAVHMTTRTVQAVNYQHHGGETKIDFAGTSVMPSANGVAEVKSQRGSIAIEAEFGDLQKPTAFGTEYLTYVLWAISPEGRAVNLGEVLVGGNHRSKVSVTTDLQAFAMIVTAEPYYAVRLPSDVVVLENVVRSDTKGTTEAVNAKYELMGRGGYIPTGYKFDPVVLDARLPLEFMEARNAVRIAQSEGAERYAGESYQHAVQLMDTADRYATEKHSNKKELIATSRETVQTAEDARAIAVKNLEEAARNGERQNSANALAQSQADAANSQANMAAAQADATAAQAQAAKAQADMAANQASSTAQVNAANAAADQSRAAAETAEQNQRQAENDKATLRAQLVVRLNEILQTRDSARGLIVNMSDVLFDTGKFSLNPGAREKLAKVAGILISYPSLNTEIGGYTDNVGSDDRNQTLSENRANAVRDYLVHQGVSTDSVSARGFGNSSPVASNDNSGGRQSNRRVELVVTGDAIGAPGTGSTASIQ